MIGVAQDAGDLQELEKGRKESSTGFGKSPVPQTSLPGICSLQHV